MESNRLKILWVFVLTAVVVCLGIVNLEQRTEQQSYFDGIDWRQSQSEVVAVRVYDSNHRSPEGARVEPGDRLLSVEGHRIRDLDDYVAVTRMLEAQGEGHSVKYRLVKGESGAEAVLDGSLRLHALFQPIDYALILLASLFLAIGCFVQLRSWKSEGAFHFYLICLSAFVALLFRNAGTANAFDLAVYWLDLLSLLILPALLLHLCLYFPKPLSAIQALPRLRGLVYLPAILLALVQGLWFQGRLQPLGLPRNTSTLDLLDRLHFVHFGVLAIAAVLVLFAQRQAAGTIERRQIKWIAYGALGGIMPFGLFYGLPWLMGFVPGLAMQASVISLGLMPLGFAYAITRYRLMDVDLIFRKGLTYAVASSALIGAYIGLVLLLSRILQGVLAPGDFTVFAVAGLLTALVFAPFKARVQEQIDRYFYKRYYDARRSFNHFGQKLGDEIQLTELAEKICSGVEAALGVSPVTLFLRDERDPDLFRLYRTHPAQGNVKRSLRFPRELLTVTAPIQVSYSGLTAQEATAGEGVFSDWGIEYIQPLAVRGRAIGFMGLGKRSGELLDSDDLELVSAMAQYGAVAIDNAILFDSLESKAGQLSRLKAYSENVVESITVGVAVVDPDGRVTVWNGAMASMVELRPKQALGKNIQEIFPAGLIAPIRDILDGEEWVVSDTRHLYKTRIEGRRGENRLANITLTPFLGQKGVEDGLLILFEDVTDRARLESQLQQAEKLSSIGLFAAGVAHEVNTPLAGISSYAQMLLQDSSPEQPGYETLKKIEQQSFRASKIVNNLLNFARISDSTISEVSLNNLLAETVSLLEHQFKNGAVEVDLELDPYLPRTMGEGGKLQQVFMNLFLNAKDAMPEGGRIRVKTYRRDSNAVIEVNDNGCGISKEDLKKIYDPFFTTKDVGRGTGLGLSVSYGIIQEHSGRIQVDSQPGKGTTFRIQLPVNRIN